MKCMGNKFWKRCCKIRQKLKKTKGREPLGVYKDILDQMARADQEVAEAEMLELEAAAAADQHLVDQAGDESDDLDMEELLDDVGMNLCGNQIYGTFVLNRRVDLHAIDATPARWRGDVGSSPLDGASAAAPAPRNDLVHPTHSLISTQV